MLPGKERRACIRAEILIPASDTSSTTCTIFATHLQHDSDIARSQQMREILNRAALEPRGKLLFILGDLNHAAPKTFNANTDSLTTDPVEMARNAGFNDLHQLHATQNGSVAESTFPAANPDQRIDYILCNQKLRVLEARVPRSMASDHLPLVIRVQLP